MSNSVGILILELFNRRCRISKILICSRCFMEMKENNLYNIIGTFIDILFPLLFMVYSEYLSFSL